MAAFKFVVRDNGAKRAVKLMTQPTETLSVGVMTPEAGQPHPGGDGVTIGEVALFNEVGTDHIPARPWLRGWVAQQLDKIERDLVRSFQQAITKKTPVKGILEKLGTRYVKEIRRRIIARIPPPNAASTIALKGSDTPLIDGQTLIDSITRKVETDDGS